ncbi:MAG: hypothetical protein ACXWQO_05480 [Bdellovibrionota bacterium]
MKLCSLFLAVLFVFAGIADAKPKKKGPKPDPSKMSSVELRNTAESELQNVAIPKGAKTPVAVPAEAMVSTDILHKEAQEPLAPSEVEAGVQAYRPIGSGKVSNAETYSFNGLSSKPMFLVGGRHWFYQALRTSTPIRAGLGFQGGLSSNVLNIQTSSGFVYDDVHLNSLLAMVGPEAEYFIDGRRHLAIGTRVAVGRLLSTQSSRNSTINQSQGSGIWEAGGHVRFQPSSSFFVRAAYARRANLGSTEGIRAQENNFEALIGFGM